ncbi:hypothetical protein PROFUN_02590 [Planoprotostelium fungivorum]|uniref:Uncharacterized protein n=1 Tax=Planoprotostelium fungivorum TaxID=1890364 RepID=A0A2P6MPE8_9EUKA|nr:hypothetical protein PROFUN_02590 [Planoprotostelium fungivorum]
MPPLERELLPCPIPGYTHTSQVLAQFQFEWHALDLRFGWSSWHLVRFLLIKVLRVARRPTHKDQNKLFRKTRMEMHTNHFQSQHWPPAPEHEHFMYDLYRPHSHQIYVPPAQMVPPSFEGLWPQPSYFQPPPPPMEQPPPVTPSFMDHLLLNDLEWNPNKRFKIDGEDKFSQSWPGAVPTTNFAAEYSSPEPSPRNFMRGASKSSTTMDNPESNWFYMVEPLKSRQRKSYKSETRYLLPNPITISLKDSARAAKIQSGTVTVELVDSDGQQLSNEKRRYLDAGPSSGLSQHLTKESTTRKFYLKVLENSKNGRFRLLFIINFTTTDGLPHSETIYSNEFVVRYANKYSGGPKERSRAMTASK